MRFVRFRDVLRDPEPVSRGTVARAILLVTLPLLLMLLVGLLWAIHVGQTNGDHTRQIHAVSCRNWLAMRDQIVEDTARVSQKELTRLGLGNLSARQVNEATARRRVVRLARLGPPPPGCR